MKAGFFALLSAISGVVSLPLDSTHESGCKAINYTLHASAPNRVVKGEPKEVLSSFENLQAYLAQDVAFQQVNGTFTLRGTYCPPQTSHPKHKAPLMLFVHGITYSRTYWSSLETPAIFPNQNTPAYNWVDYASKKGYHVLSIDRLGDGESDHPDWRKFVQLPFGAAIIGSLIEDLRESHDDIVYVGHSQGSLTATVLASMSPSIVNTYILTGIALPGPHDNSLPGIYFGAKPQIASEFDPARFPPSVFGPGYLVTSSKEGRASAFYSQPGKDYDVKLYDRDFATQQTVSLAELLSSSDVSKFTGRVFAMTGVLDAAFCGNATLGTADCRPGRAGGNKVDDYLSAVWPQASVKQTYLQEKAGHDHLLHFTWEDGVKKAHEFLDQA